MKTTEPGQLKLLLSEVSPEMREKLAAAVLERYVEDGHMDSVVNKLPSNDARALGIAALSRHFGTDFQEIFKSLDQDASGTISKTEFKRYISSVLPKLCEGDASPPTTRQLVLFALNSAIPFVVFGCLDNSIMIVGGDVVDDIIGSTFKLSTVACAAVANTFADVLGISIGNTVEALTARLGLPSAGLTPGQAQLTMVRRIGLASGSLGIFVGCIMGMTPLLFMDEAEKEEKKALKEAFAKIDTNGNGQLDIMELKGALLTAGFELHEGRLNEIARSMDVNKDGKISISEFLGKFSRFKSALAESK